MDTVYTEDELQDYAAGTFRGDKWAFEDFLSKNEYAQKQIALYKVLFQDLKEETVPELSFDLSSRVVGIIEARQNEEMKKEIMWNIPLYGMGVIFIVTLVYTGRYFFPEGVMDVFKNGVFWLGGAVVLGFVYLFNYVDMEKKRHAWLLTGGE